MCLFAICLSSLEKYLFKYFTHFSVVFLLLSFMNSYIYWIQVSYKTYDLQIRSPILWVVFSLS